MSTDISDTSSESASSLNLPASRSTARNPHRIPVWICRSRGPPQRRQEHPARPYSRHPRRLRRLPQTTRNRIVGIHTTEDLQAVLVDTPGLHKARSRLNRALVDVATAALEADVTCWVVDAVPPVRDIREAPQPLAPSRAHTVVGGILTDNAEGRSWYPPTRSTSARGAGCFRHRSFSKIPRHHGGSVSAKTGVWVESLVNVWRTLLPTAPLYRQWTEASERLLVAELVRAPVPPPSGCLFHGGRGREVRRGPTAGGRVPRPRRNLLPHLGGTGRPERHRHWKGRLDAQGNRTTCSPKHFRTPRCTRSPRATRLGQGTVVGEPPYASRARNQLIRGPTAQRPCRV